MKHSGSVLECLSRDELIFLADAIALVPGLSLERLNELCGHEVGVVKNSDFGVPLNHRENIEQRVNRLCAWLWDQRTPTGKTVRDVPNCVLWGSTPSGMEQRLWLGVWSDDYRLSHFGQSSLGEAVGWARPDEYPPRNNRTNKALRALGHDVQLFGKG